MLGGASHYFFALLHDLTSLKAILSFSRGVNLCRSCGWVLGAEKHRRARRRGVEGKVWARCMPIFDEGFMIEYMIDVSRSGLFVIVPEAWMGRGIRDYTTSLSRSPGSSPETWLIHVRVSRNNRGRRRKGSRSLGRYPSWRRAFERLDFDWLLIHR